MSGISMAEVYSKTEENKVGYISKLVAIVAFICIIVALFLIRADSPATGYELSIYSALPSLTWICLIAAIFCGMAIITYQALNKKEGNFWLIGFAILIITISIILLLPIFRGYFLYGLSDSLAHLQYTSSIVSEGHFTDNYYPVTHILGAELTQVLGIKVETVMKLLPVIFTVLFIVFIYLIAKVVSFKKGHALLAAAVGTVPVFAYYHVVTYPFSLSLLAVPILIYCYFVNLKHISVPWKIAFLIALFLFPFFHPITQIGIVIVLISAEIAKWLWTKRTSQVGIQAKISFSSVVISTATFFLWISYFLILGPTIQRIYNWLTGEANLVARVGEIETTLGRLFIDPLELVIKMYGQNLMLILLFLVAFGLIAHGLWRRRNEFRDLYILSIILVVGGLIYLLLSMGLGLITWGRFLGVNLGLWGVSILAGFALYEVFSNIKRLKTITVFLIAIILTVISTLGIFSIYRSPWVLQPNWQITHADINGDGWMNQYKREGIPITEIGWVRPYRQVNIPEHFGYPNYVSLGESLNEDTFLIITERFKQASVDPTLIEQGIVSHDIVAKPGFNEDDFIQIEADKSAAKLYTNGEFDIFFVSYIGE